MGLFSGIAGKTFSSDEDEVAFDWDELDWDTLDWDTLDWDVLGSIELDWLELETAEEEVVSFCEEMSDVDEEVACFCWQEKRSVLDKIKNKVLLFIAFMRQYYNDYCSIYIDIFNFMKKQ